mgnify:CR=1 FL=1
MSILNKLAIKNLKLNKRRTISTIIGIALSAALICAVGNMFASFRETSMRSWSYEGYYHVSLINLTEDQLEEVKLNRDIKNVNTLYHIDKAEDSSKCFYMNFDSVGDSNPSDLGFKLLEGSFPKNNSEIVVTKEALKYVGEDLKIGDSVNLNLAKKEIKDNRSGCVIQIQ